jgi:hypothetical protein
MPEYECCGFCEFNEGSNCDAGGGVRSFVEICKFSPSRFQEKTGREYRKGGWPVQRHIIHGEKPKDQVEFRDKKGKKVSFKKGRKKDGSTKPGKKR